MRTTVTTITCDGCGYVFDEVERPNILVSYHVAKEGSELDLCVFCTNVIYRLIHDSKDISEEGLRTLSDLDLN